MTRLRPSVANNRIQKLLFLLQVEFGMKECAAVKLI